MTFVPAQLVHDHVASSGSSLVNTAANYTSGRLYLVFVGGSGTTGRTVTGLSGAGGSWAEINGGTDAAYTDGTSWAVTCWWCTDATGSSQQLTATYSGSWSASRFMHVYEIPDGFDTSGLVVQDEQGSQAPTATQATVPLVDSAAAGNMRVGYFVHRIQEALTAANGGTKVNEQQVATPGSVKALWYRTDSTTADPSVTWSTNSRGAVFVGLEIKAAAAGVTGTAAWTEAADTAAAAGESTNRGTAAWTEAADTAAAAGESTNDGTAAWTEDADTAAAAGESTNRGAAAWTEDADTCAASGAVGSGDVTGTAAWTEAADTAAAAGESTNRGTAAWTEAADTAAAAGESTNDGTAAWTEDADTAAAAGESTNRGAAAWTEDADTIVAFQTDPLVPSRDLAHARTQTRAWASSTTRATARTRLRSWGASA